MFGVTPASIASYANGLIFRDAAVGPPAVSATQPSLTDVNTQIDQASQVVSAWLHGLGIDAASLSTSNNADTYAIAHRMVCLDVAAWVILARERGNPENARELRRQYDAMLSQLTKQRQSLGTGRPIKGDSPGLVQTLVSGTRKAPATQPSDFWRRSGGRL